MRVAWQTLAGREMDLRNTITLHQIHSERHAGASGVVSKPGWKAICLSAMPDTSDLTVWGLQRTGTRLYCRTILCRNCFEQHGPSQGLNKQSEPSPKLQRTLLT